MSVQADPCCCCGVRPQAPGKLECLECDVAGCFFRNSPVCNVEPADGKTVVERFMEKVRAPYQDHDEHRRA